MPEKEKDVALIREHLNDAAALILDAFSSIRQAAAVVGVPIVREATEAGNNSGARAASGGPADERSDMVAIAPTPAAGRVSNLRIGLRASYHYEQALAAIEAVEELLSELREFHDDLDDVDGPYKLPLHSQSNLSTTVSSIAEELEESTGWLTSRLLAELHELVAFAELAERLSVERGS